MRRLVALLMLTMLLVPPVLSAGDTSTGEKLINSSEPAFLRDIGPQMPRTDNPVAAGITAVVVAAIIGRGIHKYGRGVGSKPDTDDVK